jgi:protein-S-isoprenylcysteine O-methyltransferase Ste14
MRIKVVVRFVTLMIAFGCILMGAAGTIRYWQAWTFLALMGGVSLASMIYLQRTDPALLERRLRRQEQRPVQKIFHYSAIGTWLLAFVLAGLNHRYGWAPTVPRWACALGLAAVACGFVLVFATLRTNTFASATIGLERDQRVISTGPYRFVRHPMYSGIAVFVVGMPIGLGSVMALAATVILIAMLVLRLLDEEKLLRAELPGYAEYCACVRWRLLPRVY